MYTAGMRRLPLPVRCCRPVILAWAVAVWLAGCGTYPAERSATAHGFTAETVAGDPFLHRIFRKEGTGQVLHVYLEGDGRPWRTRNRVSLDPTPDNPVVLELMALDSAPALYLGRPCYFGVKDPLCSPDWWTDRRYAETVVASLDRVIDRYVEDRAGIVLIGHSGGGALAMLLAERRSDVLAVVTLAGNLDTGAWAKRHGYTPLSGSLNPADRPPLGNGTRQLHLVGAHDEVITTAMLEAVLEARPGAEMRIVAGADHSCCWRDVWPEVLAELDAE